MMSTYHMHNGMLINFGCHTTRHSIQLLFFFTHKNNENASGKTTGIATIEC